MWIWGFQLSRDSGEEEENPKSPGILGTTGKRKKIPNPAQGAAAIPETPQIPGISREPWVGL